MLGGLYIAFGLFIAWRAPTLLLEGWRSLGPLVPAQHGGRQGQPVLLVLLRGTGAGGGAGAMHLRHGRLPEETSPLGIAVAMVLFGFPASIGNDAFIQTPEQSGTGVWPVAGMAVRHAIGPLTALAILLVASAHVLVLHLSSAARAHFDATPHTPVAVTREEVG